MPRPANIPHHIVYNAINSPTRRYERSEKTSGREATRLEGAERPTPGGPSGGPEGQQQPGFGLAEGPKNILVLYMPFPAM